MPMYSYPPPPGPIPQPYMIHPGMPTPQNSAQTPMAHSTPMPNMDNQAQSQDHIAPSQAQTQMSANQTPGAIGNPTSGSKTGLLKLGAAGSTLGLDGAGAAEGSVAGADATAGTGASGRSVGLVQISGVDPHSQITLLLAELDRLKEKNKKVR